MPQNRTVHLEERLAHLQRLVEEMSDEMARQGQTLALLERRVQLLMTREAAREAEGSGGVVLGDERPPHY